MTRNFALTLPVVCTLAALTTAVSGMRGGVPTQIAPDHPLLLYSDYVEIDVQPTFARMNRSSVPSRFGGADMAPGARINFRTDALDVQFGIDFDQGCFGCPGRMRLEIDGVLEEEFFENGSQAGTVWFTAISQFTATPHDFSIVLPYDLGVDFLGLTLEGGSADLTPPAPRPSTVFVAYGDSLTHGFVSSSVATTWPYTIGKIKDWSVVNLGFVGQEVTPTDGLVVAGVGGDVISVEIGNNDYWAQTELPMYEANYHAMLDNIRATQPVVPIFVITPTRVDHETIPNTLGHVMEDYRISTRNVIEARADTDPYLALIEGPDLVPFTTTNFWDGVHLLDVGAILHAVGMADPNLVREPGFEQGAYLWELTGKTGLDPVSPIAGSFTLMVAGGPNLAAQRLYGLHPNTTYRLDALALMRGGIGNGWLGVSFYDAAGAEILAARTLVTGSGLAAYTLSVTAPAAYETAKIWAWADSDVLLLDGLQLVEE